MKDRISIEGREIVSDERRGKKNVFNKTITGLENCLKQGLLTGVATSGFYVRSAQSPSINDLAGLLRNWPA